MSQDEHTLNKFDVEIEEIRACTLRMGGLVEIQFHDAIQALRDTNSNHARQIIDKDKAVNQLEVEIDALCCNAIACYKPTANDLRLIISVTKIIVHLERIGDEAKKIAQITERRAYSNHLTLTRFQRINHVIELTQILLKDVLDSFARLEPIQSDKIFNINHTVKSEIDNILRQVIQSMTENTHNISTSLDFLLVTKTIERINDHAKSIADLVMHASSRYKESNALIH